MLMRSGAIGLLAALVLAGCAQDRLSDEAIGTLDVRVDPHVRQWQAQAAADRHYVRITWQFVRDRLTRDRDAPSDIYPLCHAGRVSQLEGADRSVAITILMPGAESRTEVPLLLMRGRDASTASADTCIDIEGGTVMPASRLGTTGDVAIGARQVEASRPNPPVAAIAGATAQAMDFFTFGSNPIVGTLTDFTADRHIATLQGLWRNFSASEANTEFSPFGDGPLTLDDIRAGRTISILPITLIRTGLFGTDTPVRLGQIELRAVVLASLLTIDTRDDGVPFFQTGLDLNLPVQTAGRPAAVPLWDALDAPGTPSERRLRHRAEKLSGNATAAEIRQFCRDVENSTTRLGFALYDRLAVQAAVLRETRPWKTNSPALSQRSHPCFRDGQPSLLFNMGFPPTPTSALARPLAPLAPPALPSRR
jgi:hypothetical protein